MVKTRDLVVEEEGPCPQNWPVEVAVAESSPSMAEEVGANRSRRPEEEVGGSLVGPRRRRRWVEAAVEGEGCPSQLEVEGSWSAGVSVGQQVSRHSWQPKEAVEEEGRGPEEVEGGFHPSVEEEVEEVCFQSPEEQALIGVWEHDRWPGLGI